MNANKTLTFFAIATVATLGVLGAAVIIDNLVGTGGLAALASGVRLPRTSGLLGIGTIGAAAGALLFMCSERFGARDEYGTGEY